MTQHGFSSLAALAALVFLVMAISACASSEHARPAQYKGNGVAEYHGAHIGNDNLRERLPGE